MKKTIRNALALALVLALTLTFAAASATTVTVRASIDREAAKKVMTGFGMDEETAAMIDPFLALASALGLKVTTVEDGAQIDFDLNGNNAISLGAAADADGASLVSTLFPNYRLTVKPETIQQMMESFASQMPGANSEEGGMDMNAMAEKFGGYIMPFMEACSAAAVPGEPVPSDFEYDGYRYDTMVPVTVDMPAIAAAFDKMTADMLNDETIVAFLQASAQRSGRAFEMDELKEALAEFRAHFPDVVTAEFYADSGNPQAFYLAGQAGYDGEDEPAYDYIMHFRDQADMEMRWWDHNHGMESGMVLKGSALSLDFSTEAIFVMLNCAYDDGDPAEFRCDLYLNTENPLLGATVNIASGGARTLPMEAPNALAVEDLMSGSSDAASGFYGDIMMNGLGTVMAALSEAVPEMAALLGGGN